MENVKLCTRTEQIDPNVNILPTDSRLRPDRLALELGDDRKACTEKRSLEEKQREAKASRAKNQQEWKPKYFERDIALGWRLKGKEIPNL